MDVSVRLALWLRNLYKIRLLLLILLLAACCCITLQGAITKHQKSPAISLRKATVPARKMETKELAKRKAEDEENQDEEEQEESEDDDDDEEEDDDDSTSSEVTLVLDEDGRIPGGMPDDPVRQSS